MQKTFGRAASHASVSAFYDGKIAGMYDLEETLGRGHFAVVKLARHVFTGEKVAVKVIDKTKLDEVSRAHLFQEVRCMKLVQHPNVVRLYEVIDTQTKLYLILELGDGGDLYDYIMKHEHGLDEELARHYFRQVVHAISYCHKLHVVHRDLKPENVVFFEKLNMVKLTDFGFSNRFNPGQKLETSCGSLAYSAPEILLGDSYDAPAVDIWSLGVILYMLVCGHPPFQEANDSETLTMIMDCKYTVPAHVSEGCRRLIGLMLQREPEHRATLEGIANDAWLQAGSPVTPADYLPLVSREHLSEDDHALIIQKMVNGKIATKEEILESLDKNEYNQTTATYFLLAERKLRAQRHEQAQIINQGQRLAVLTPEKPPVVKERPFLPSDKKRSMLTLTPVHIQPPATPKVDSPELPRRPRQCSIVTEEDEDALSGAGSTGRRSQRTSNSSLASSQRSSSSSLANQRVSNQNLAQSLRNRGIFNSAAVNNSVTVNPVGIPSKSMHLDLDKENRLIPVVVPGAGTISEPPVPCTQKILAAPAPFPTTSNLGLGLRSPRTSPLTSPVVTPRAVPAALYRTPSIERTSGKNTPSSLSPTSPSTPSSPGSSNSPSSLMSPPGSGSTLPLSSSSIGSNKGGGGRSLSSPNRMLHAVRSSPQLVLNEIFEEGENESESEMTDHIEGNTRNRTRVDVTSSSSARPHHHRKSHWRASSLESRVSTGNASNSTLVASTANPSPNLVRRYEQRRKMAKARTASCSSSDASDEDSDARKKRAEKWKAFPRRDSHDDSSDPGNDHNDPGNSGGAGSDQGMRHSGQQGTAGQNHAAGADSKASGSGATTNHSNKGRSCPLAREETEEEEEDEEPDATTPVRLYTPHRRPSSAHRHRYRLRPPNLVGSDTLLRSSQSLTSLAEVCENGESPVLGAKSKPGLLQVTAKPVLQARSTGDVTNHGGGLPQASYDDLLHSPLTLVLSREPAKQRRTMVAEPVFYKGNVRPLSADVSGATEGSGGSLHCNGGLLLVRDDSDLTTLQGISNDLNGGTTADVTALTLKTKSLGRDAKLTVSPSPAMKTSTLDSSSSKATAASTHTGFKGTFRRLRPHKPQPTEKEPRRPVSAEEGSAWTPLSAKPVGASLGQSASFRSRLHKAKSLGSLVKERLLCEASQCQFELWRRFGGKKGGDVNGNAAAWRRTLGWSKLRHTAGGMDKESMTPLPLRTCAHGVTHVQGVGTRCSLC